MEATKDVQVLKFGVRYEGERYGQGEKAGSIIYGMPEEMADKLIAGSNGTVVELPRREAVEPRGKKEKKGAPAADAGAVAGSALPSVDPGNTVKK